MICLSKADESTFRHLDFNQSPPPLSASHTTCQDLNGMANLREHVAADQEDGGGGTGGGPFATGAANQKIRGEAHSPWPAETLNAGRWAAFSSLRSSAASGGTDQKNRNLCPSSNNRSRIWSWISWILSVLVTAVAVSHHNSKLSPAPLQQPVSQPVVSPAANTLTKRATCATGGADPDEYNLPFHVGALFIILTVSFLGCAFPILAAKIPGLRIPGRFFFIVRHFGTGVLIATAFVHLLPTAFTSLGNPCLGDFWTKDYPAMPGAIALAAVFLVTVIEMVFHPSRHVPPASIVSNRGVGCMSNMAMELTSTGKDCCPSGISHPVRDMGPLAGRASSMAQGLSDLDRSSSAARDAIAEQARTGQPAKEEFGVSTDSESDVQVLTSEQQLRKDRLQCILLEMGILFHSVFIGMALSVSTGNEFIILLIAIVFHQTFEGLALGSRIAKVSWSKDTIQPWLMALAYGCTTPLGQAIGLATHTLYSPDSEVGLIMVGVMNAISAGLLTFASLVELLSEDFLSDASWRYLRGKERVAACFLVLFGAFGMSLVGVWA